ncbi:MAG: urease accessory protein UreE [Gammaproteobacteria bacterium]|nr:urease accessory protein UreE [Gammaproteobacteria bacterium]
MIKLTAITSEAGSVATTLTLPLQSRIKSRLRVTLDNGEDAGLFLPRGSTLKEGDLLMSQEGYRVAVVAARETLSSIHCDNPHLLARVCYHLGNRHVSIQIDSGGVSYPHDPVLDAMVQGLGLTVVTIEAPFEPEPGAYGGSAAKGHQHGHSHNHAHSQDAKEGDEYPHHHHH